MEKSLVIQQKITDLKEQLAKPITAFQTGGFRPTGEATESWLGRVFVCKPTQAKPVLDKAGKPLYALAQFYLPALPFVPEKLNHVTWLTVFLGEELPDRPSRLPLNELNDDGETKNRAEGWLIREYTVADELVTFEFPQQGIPKPFPLKPFFKDQDFPLWDGGGVPYEIEKEICTLDNFGDEDNPDKLNYYEDIVGDNHSYLHKFGGYPSFCQSGVSFEGFDFMFQISSDDKANFNVVDSGSLLFFRNDEGEWLLYYDFY